jgi:hypothetical protein
MFDEIPGYTTGMTLEIRTSLDMIFKAHPYFTLAMRSDS